MLKKAVILDLTELLDAHLLVLMVKTKVVYSGKIRPSLRRLTVNQVCRTEKKSIALMRIVWARPAPSLHREA